MPERIGALFVRIAFQMEGSVPETQQIIMVVIVSFGTR